MNENGREIVNYETVHDVPAIADDKETRDAACKEMYLSGMNARQISAELNINYTTVYKILKRQNVALRGTGNYERSPSEKKRLREMVKQIRPDNRGVRLSPKTEFKEGHTPWNKGIKWPEMAGDNHPSRMPQHRATYERVWANRPVYRKRGSEHHRWKGGKTPLIMRIRNSPQYAEWRQGVFERDNFTCYLCGDGRGGNLEAHHIRLLSDMVHKFNVCTFEEALAVKEIWDIDNGITLCNKCHPAANDISRITAILNDYNEEEKYERPCC
ncbi:MAG: hypothetical protein PHQ43_12375 [Dehalococcoidales bacterium]|nr:hypothetical protein [Dehalococcoidales bacterium]